MLLAYLVALLLAAEEPAATPDGALEQERQAAVALLAAGKARQLEVVAGEDAAAATLHDKPLLRWSNPTAGSVFGEVYVWQRAGRPVAISSIYRWYHPLKDSTVEIVSLSEGPVLAREGDVVHWDSRSAGVSFKELADAPAPSATAAGRLVQMRALARQFTAQLVDKRGGDAVIRELRLLGQPVHRYESPQAGVVDGAMFAFVETTDPEAWLLLQCTQAGERRSWRHALARMNSDELQIKQGDRIAAQWPKVAQPWKHRTATYTLFGFDPELVKTESPK